MKMKSIYDTETGKICPGLNPTAPQEPQAHRLKILTEIEACFLDRNWSSSRVGKKDETNQYNHKCGGSRSNNINSYYWGGGVSIVTFACGVGMPVRIALSELAYYFLLKQLLHKNILYYLP